MSTSSSVSDARCIPIRSHLQLLSPLGLFNAILGTQTRISDRINTAISGAQHLRRRCSAQIGESTNDESVEASSDASHRDHTDLLDTPAHVDLSLNQVTESPLPTHILEKIATFRITQKELIRAQQELIQAQEPNEELSARLEAAMQKCTELARFNSKMYGEDETYLEWNTRIQDLFAARQSILERSATQEVDIRELDFDLREQGEEIVDLIETWLAELAMTTKEPIVVPVIPYDAPFDMALIETTEHRCEEQARIDEGTTEDLKNLSFIRPEDEGQWGRSELVDAVLEWLQSTKDCLKTVSSSLRFMENYKTSLEAGGPISKDQPEDFDLEAQLESLHTERHGHIESIRLIAIWARRVNLLISPEGEVLKNPEQARDVSCYTTGSDNESIEDEELNEEQSAELLEINKQKIKSWMDIASFETSPGDAPPTSPSTPNAGLIELTPQDSITAIIREGPYLGYCNSRKQIDRWQAQCAKVRQELPEEIRIQEAEDAASSSASLFKTNDEVDETQAMDTEGS